MSKQTKQILTPVSLGELVDKLTILEIKAQNITNQDKLLNINNEYKALTEVLSKSGVVVKPMLRQNLKDINIQLWKIEDDIRDLERAKNFGDDFIKLARDVYITNDKRFLAKDKINKDHGSFYKEEKSYSNIN